MTRNTYLTGRLQSCMLSYSINDGWVDGLMVTISLYPPSRNKKNGSSKSQIKAGEHKLAATPRHHHKSKLMAAAAQAMASMIKGRVRCSCSCCMQSRSSIHWPNRFTHQCCINSQAFSQTKSMENGSLTLHTHGT
jgi:hypothetical protein